MKVVEISDSDGKEDEKKKKKDDEDDDDDGAVVMELDSTSDHNYDDDGDDEDGQRADKHQDPVVFFNSASSQELQEILRIPGQKAEVIMACRPYADIDHLYAMLTKARGVSAQLVTRYEELMEGYEAVDKLIAHCENEARRVVPPTLSKRLFESMAATKQPAGLAPGFRLKGYQIAGVQWLLSLYSNKLKGGILADEMGLGKTAQVIAFVSELKDTLHEPGPHLIIVPSSTLDNWSREFDKFCPGLRVINYYGTQAERAELRDDILELRDTDDAYHAVISTYSVATSDKYDRVFMRKMQFKTMILDEGHLVKNFASDRYIRIMQINVSFRLLLTGTPLQNNLQELLSILTFVLPLNKHHDLDAMRAVFQPAHVREVDGQGKRKASKYAILSNHRMELAKRMLDPFILRRRKCQVLSDLPKKIRRQVLCPMTPLQRRVYAQIDRQSRDECRQGAVAGSGTVQSNAIIQLRKAACHPMLFRTLYTDDILAKMATELLKALMETRNEQYLRLDGSTKVDLRQDMLDTFARDPSISVFLLSTKAGGFGLNITSANVVILYDPDFNPHNDRQAEDRAHRVGQTKDVLVYGLISRESIELRNQ
ncbi:SNF2 family N-terminal domain-containing protein [Syncephalis pseudoplumigaleata]|uniref:SNF2 family N-terminal domain-containing protein n=1 Tax=Syncephalis pseudoplumigaleata TaxID=1712513 RepID=A0A4P9Z222_9FUNG|nr:SNF2 family N-terminal domain-containing protein [Syncephalis pseudoplumigaleata]|eukprot:RKP25490.1 SNF2 family N-terminal domain-containing protein [Syncephalis pseudoplumigaleata]